MGNNELEMGEYDLIVSMTDPRGYITYCNDIFAKMAEFTYDEVLGQPHNIIRHPDMPKAVFKLLWNRVQANKPLFAFVKNKSKNGNYYWVKAFVYPVVINGQLSKIVSYRKKITPFIKQEIGKIYSDLLMYEASHSADQSLEYLINGLEDKGLTYDRMVDKLSLEQSI